MLAITSGADGVFGCSMTWPKSAAFISSRSALKDVSLSSPFTSIESLKKEPFIPCAAPLMNTGGDESDNIAVTF